MQFPDALQRRIPEATVSRLPLYLRSLLDFSERDISTVSSEKLAAATGVNAAKVRKDLSYLGSYGTRGVGYDVEFLVHAVSQRLGLTRDRKAGIAGVGNLGRALVNYRGFGERGFRIAACFDSDPDKVGTAVNDMTVSSIDAIESVVHAKDITIGIIATPAAAAQDIADRFVAGGVTGILNFAPAVLTVPSDITLRKVDLSIELQILAFYVGRDSGLIQAAIEAAK
ncbi:MAG: redox-sensing transcriptional repressor Rex [Acidimicrobiia bacterium]